MPAPPVPRAGQVHDHLRPEAGGLAELAPLPQRPDRRQEQAQHQEGRRDEIGQDPDVGIREMGHRIDQEQQEEGVGEQPEGQLALHRQDPPSRTPIPECK